MRVTLVGKNKIEVVTETELEKQFWENTKKETRELKVTVRSLKRNIRATMEELSYLKKELRSKK